MLNTLKRIVDEVNVASDINEGLQAAVTQIRQAVHSDVASIFLLNKEDSRYYLIATDGLNREAIGEASLSIAEGLVGQIGMRQEPLNLEEGAIHPQFHYLEATGEEQFSSFLGVPLTHARRLLGVLVVQQKVARRFDESEEAFLATISTRLAHAIVVAEATQMITRYPQHKRSGCYKGIAAASGIGIGVTVVYYPKAAIEAVPERFIADADSELARLQSALEGVRADIDAMAIRIEDSLGKEESTLFGVYLRMLDDAALGGEIAGQILQHKLRAESALVRVVRGHIRNFELMEDPYLRERASDVKDLALRVLTKLEAQTPEALREYPDKTILVGEEITASMLAEIPREKLVAVVSVQGAINSHMSIVARSMAIPTVVGVLGLPVAQLDEKPLIVDGYRGEVMTYPTEAKRQQFERILLEEQALLADLDKLVDQAAETPDGVKISLWVNTGLFAEVPKPIRRSVAGVGLYRSEVPFMAQERFPSEDEQVVVYRKQLEAFFPHPVAMRTLDVGGDKPLSYFPIFEENPALGWRGIRITLDHPEIFLVQIRAMLKASVTLNNLRILLPMISTLSEVEQAQKLLKRVYLELIEEGIEVVMPKVGVMIEVPAAAYQARQIAARVDFLAVGSNDLAQYLLAVDRNNPRVASLYSAYHPALLSVLQALVKDAGSAGKPISVCGEMAGDPGTALLLIAMGYENLSMSAAHLLKVKSVIRQVSMKAAKQMLLTILKMDKAEEIHQYVESTLEEHGLSGLVRPLY